MKFNNISTINLLPKLCFRTVGTLQQRQLWGTVFLELSWFSSGASCKNDHCFQKTLSLFRWEGQITLVLLNLRVSDTSACRKIFICKHKNKKDCFTDWSLSSFDSVCSFFVPFSPSSYFPKRSTWGASQSTSQVQSVSSDSPFAFGKMWHMPK